MLTALALGRRCGQIVSIVALVLAYAAASSSRHDCAAAAPYRPAGPVFVVYWRSAARDGDIMGRLWFFPRSFQKDGATDVGLVRVSYGFFGALIGPPKGFVIVWLIFVVLRLLGSVAEVRVEMAKHPLPEARTRDRWPRCGCRYAGRGGDLARGHEVSPGRKAPSGGLLDRLDPFPNSVHRVVPENDPRFSDERSTRRLQISGMNSLLKQPISPN
jgi:hypothetical protein